LQENWSLFGMTGIERFLLDFYTVMALLALGIYIGRYFLPKERD